MSKLLLSFFILALSIQVQAQSCEVYGISDSPQKLQCKFQDQVLSLHCENGTYYLNTTPVKLAFHMEVEEGPVPLVFKTDESTLTLMVNSKTDITAEFEKSSTTLQGKCR